MGISLLRVMQAVLTSFCVCSTEFGAGKWYSDISMQFYSESASLQEVVRQAGFERRSILCPIYNAVEPPNNDGSVENMYAQWN
jgi:hypothetical protein